MRFMREVVQGVRNLFEWFGQIAQRPAFATTTTAGTGWLTACHRSSNEPFAVVWRQATCPSPTANVAMRSACTGVALAEAPAVAVRSGDGWRRVERAAAELGIRVQGDRPHSHDLGDRAACVDDPALGVRAPRGGDPGPAETGECECECEGDEADDLGAEGRQALGGDHCGGPFFLSSLCLERSLSVQQPDQPRWSRRSPPPARSPATAAAVRRGLDVERFRCPEQCAHGRKPSTTASCPVGRTATPYAALSDAGSRSAVSGRNAQTGPFGSPGLRALSALHASRPG